MHYHIQMFLVMIGHETWNKSALREPISETFCYKQVDVGDFFFTVMLSVIFCYAIDLMPF